MAFLLSGLGSSEQLGVAASRAAGHGSLSKAQPFGLYAASFGGLLNGQVDALGAGDPLAALQALVQNGTTISTIAERLAGQVASAMQPGLAASAGTSSQTFAGSIAAALSPPSNAPPGASAAQEVAALARRLQQWLEGNAGEADRSGQQDETSGQLLDAGTAKELPAQNDSSSPASRTLDASALSRALLASVAASFASVAPVAGTPSAGAPARASTIGKTVTSAKAATSPLAQDGVASQSREAAVAQSDAALLAMPSGAPSAAGPGASVLAASDSPHVQAPGTQQTSAPSQAPLSPSAAPADLLGRMLARASGADAQLTAQREAAAAQELPAMGETSAETAPRGSESQGRAQAGTISAAGAGTRSGALITQIIAAAEETANDGGSQRDGNADAASSDAPDASAPTKAAPSALADQAFSAAVLGQAPTAAGAPLNAPAQPPAPIDPTVAIEQVVKAMTMRSGTDGVSEVRLHLVPDQLGAVTMKLTVSGSAVSATAIAQNADVRSALMANQQTLTRSLAESGLKLTSFTVSLSGGEGGTPDDRSSRDQTSGFGRQYRIHEVPQGGDAELASSVGGPALVPAPMMALFNYLV